MADSPYIEINGRRVGMGHPTYVVAEVSANHRQCYGHAAELVHAAKACGASAVKVQTYTPDTLTIESDAPQFRHPEGSPWAGRLLYDLYRETYMPWEWQPQLQALARKLGLDFFSTPFDSSAVDFLQTINVPAYKIASFELVDLPLIRYVAGTGKPMLVSTGMATFDEVDEAVRSIWEAGGSQVALLKCTSAYPAAAEEMNLATIPHLQQAFGVPVGLSDHTLGISVPVAAVALGARIVEKHFTLTREIHGPDSAFSLEPHEFETMVEAIRTAEKSLGRVHYGVSEHEVKSRTFRRSLFVVRNMKTGDVFTDETVRSIRPGHGLHTRHLSQVLGRRASRAIERGTPLSWDLIV